jgi:hypothetical protein
MSELTSSSYFKLLHLPNIRFILLEGKTPVALQSEKKNVRCKINPERYLDFLFFFVFWPQRRL